MVFKRPPRNYTMEQYPLPHTYVSSFGLGATSAAKAATIIPILRSSEAASGSEAVEVNPRHGSFGVDTGMTCFNGSIVPRILFSMSLFIPEAAIATGVRHLTVKFMPLYFSFAESLKATDDKTDIEVQDILEVLVGGLSKDVTPIYAGKLFSPGLMPLSTKTDSDEAIAEWDMTTDATYEGVVFDEDGMFDALSHFTNAGMLRKAIGPIRTALIKQDRPFHYTSNNFTFPSVKRMNNHTFCGLMVWVPQADTPGQTLLDSEITDIEHVHINYRGRFDEWNPNFDQTAI